MFAIEDGRKYLAQWDTGQRLIIEDPTITEVHFAKTRDLAAVSLVETDGDRRVVKIPNVCLQPPRDLVFWLVITDPDGSSSVVHQGVIPILRRQKPDDYVEAEDDILRWIALDARLTDLEKKVETGGSGAIDPDQIAQAVEDYLKDNPAAPGAPGQAASLQITGADALAAGSVPTVIEEAGSTAQNRVYRIGIPAGKDGDPGNPGTAGKDGRGVASITGNADGSWLITYTDDTSETVSNEAYQAIKDELNSLSEEIAEIPQADWNQNDSTAPDYVKNRTHYTKMNTVLEYGVLSGFEVDGSGMFVCVLPYALDIYEGLKVEVTWDNQVYQLTATPYFGMTFIGNKIVLGGEDSGEPFFIAISKLQGQTIVGSTGTETSHEVGIVAESPVRIKPYFLPSNIAYLQNGFIPLNLVIPNDSDVFGGTIATGGMESTLENPYRNKRTLDNLTLETFNAMLDGTVPLPSFVLAESTHIARVFAVKDDGYIRVLWSSYVTYGNQGYDLSGATISIYNAKIHEDADNPGTIVSEYALITVADKRLT